MYVCIYVSRILYLPRYVSLLINKNIPVEDSLERVFHAHLSQLSRIRYAQIASGKGILDAK